MAKATEVGHEFENMTGDELTVEDLQGATWRVHSTFVDLDETGTLVFTHLIEVTKVDFLTEAAAKNPDEGEDQEP